MVKKKREIQEASTAPEPLVIEDASCESNLRACLAEIKTYDGFIGYILRNATSASIDLKDPTKIIDYAVISSSAFDTGKDLSELFDLGDSEDILVEGKGVKMLSKAIGENKISIFVENSAEIEKILRKINSL